jgi:hypothetical protein
MVRLNSSIFILAPAHIHDQKKKNDIRAGTAFALILAHLFYIPKAPGRPTSTLRRYGG